MFKSVRLGSVLGIPVTAHWTLLVLAGWLLTSKFNSGGFMEAAEAALVVSGVFASILAHEFGHILVARLYGIGATSINLSPLGGIAFLKGYPRHPGGKMAVALGGPAVSLVLAISFGLWAVLAFGAANLETPIGFLSVANSVILLFNLLPIYPMDGGQVLNAVMAKFFGDRTAGKVSMYTGQVGGTALFALGAYTGSWSFMLIGFFVFSVVSIEFRSPVLRVFVFGKKRNEAGIRNVATQPSHGIFVAFDGEGRHFAYAKHWLDCADGSDDQKRAIVEYALEARNKGGGIRHLSAEEYERQVVAAGT